MSGSKKKIPKYTNEDLQKALKAVNSGRTLGSVSEEFNIPKSTLFDKKRQGVSTPAVIKKPGPQCILGELYEEKLTEWIFYMAEQGFPITKDQLMNSVQKLMKTLDKKNIFTHDRPGRHWYEGFQSRHPELCQRISENMTYTRATVTEEKLRQWFDRTRKYLISKNLLDIDSSRVFNCDESGFSLCPKGQRVLVKRGDRSAYNFVNNDEKECITVLFCGNAAGQCLPPMIMFNYVRIPAVVAALTPKEYTIGRSDSGWMTATSFFDWVNNAFLPWVIKNGIERPVVLYLDGHSSHLTLQLSQFCRDNGIELVALYPNSTHILQPFDVAVFHPLKAAWKKVVPEWRLENGGGRLKRENFGGVLKAAVDKMNWKSILESGFRSTGLFPFNPDAVNYAKQLKSTKQPPLETASLVTEHSQMTNIEILEANIDSQLLQSFKLVDEMGAWSGDISQEGLFLVWRKMKNCQGANAMGKPPVTDEDEQNPNPPKISNEENCKSPREEDSASINNDEIRVSLQDIFSTLEDTSEDIPHLLSFHVSDEGELIPLNQSPNPTLLDINENYPSSQNMNYQNSFKGAGVTQMSDLINSTKIDQKVAESLTRPDQRVGKAGDQSTSTTSITINSKSMTAQLTPSTDHNVPGSLLILDERAEEASNHPIPLTTVSEVLSQEKNEKNAAECTSTTAVANTHDITKKCQSHGESCENNMSECQSLVGKSIKTQCPLPSFPSPLKNAVIWPSASTQLPRKTRTKVDLPSGITSDEWYEHHKAKAERERNEKEEKELRRIEREKKRQLNLEQKEAAKLARSIKKEKNLEEKLRKQELSKARKKSPNVVAKKRGVKRKKVENVIKGQKPGIAREIKKELLDDSCGNDKDSHSPPAKIPPTEP